jgi:hypothetical protein
MVGGGKCSVKRAHQAQRVPPRVEDHQRLPMPPHFLSYLTPCKRYRTTLVTDTLKELENIASADSVHGRRLSPETRF